MTRSEGITISLLLLVTLAALTHYQHGNAATVPAVYLAVSVVDFWVSQGSPSNVRLGVTMMAMAGLVVAATSITLVKN